jgi:hypothetical protein
MPRTPGPVQRDRNLRVNVSDEELDMLHALAKHAGLTISDIVRLLAREAYRRDFGDKKPPKRDA